MTSDTKFRINLREGLFELEGNEVFVDKHLEKFEEIFKMAIKEVIINNKEGLPALSKEEIIAPAHSTLDSFSAEDNRVHIIKQKPSHFSSDINLRPEVPLGGKNSKHTISKVSINIPPLPVDLKANEEKPGLREFFKDKKPANHYEKCTLFVYYITKFNKQIEVKYGEILSCYEEINEKKPSIVDIVKNSIRYKGWLESGGEKYSARLTISGENFIKFDLPKS